MDNKIKIIKIISNRFRIALLIVALSTVNIVGQINIQEDRKLSKKDSVKDKIDSTYQFVNLKSKVFNLINIFDTLPIQDTLFLTNFPYFNRLDSFPYPIIENGYIGSSSMPIGGYEFENGFKTGLNQYKPYLKKDNYYHISNAASTALYYSNGADVKEFTTSAKFSKNFKDVTLDIDYARVNNKGKYNGQENKHTDLNVGIWKGDLANKYNTFFNFSVGVHEEQVNGGVSDERSLYYERNRFRINVPVRLDDALIRKDDYSIEVNEYYRIDDNKKYFGFLPYLKGAISLSKGFYKFYDKNVRGNKEEYKSYLTDEIGLRTYYSYKSINSRLSIFGVKRKSNFIEFGTDFKYFNYILEPLKGQTAKEFSLFSDAELTLFKNLVLNWNSDVFFGEYSNEYSLKSKLSYSLSFIKFHIGISSGNYGPSLYEKQLYISNKLVYSLEDRLINKTGFDIGIKIRKLGFSASYKTSQTNNYIYYNEDLLPVYLDDKLIFQSVNIKEDIKLSIFHLDNNLFLFKSSDDKMPLPRFTAQSKFYISPYVYSKKVLLNTGFEFNYWDKFNNYGFNPVLGNYFVQNAIKLNNYMRLDYFISAKISDFHFYFRMNNVLFPYVDNEVHFKVLNYPQSDLFYRLGIKWIFVD